MEVAASSRGLAAHGRLGVPDGMGLYGYASGGSVRHPYPYVGALTVDLGANAELLIGAVRPRSHPGLGIFRSQLIGQGHRQGVAEPPGPVLLNCPVVPSGLKS
jgi:hypothetical protein